MRVLVCGGRDFSDEASLRLELGRLHKQTTIKAIVHGCCTGADLYAEAWAIDNHVPVLRYRAMWEKEGRAAGPMRNQRMLSSSEPDIVLAFPGGRGTADMVRRARAAGVAVREIAAR